ncbi:MAG: hypothetical protein ACYS17_16685, partial [Planctomycetota bacterium]
YWILRDLLVGFADGPEKKCQNDSITGQAIKEAIQPPGRKAHSRDILNQPTERYGQHYEKVQVRSECWNNK